MTETANDARLPYADRVAKLLRKAENTDSPDEANALFEKAQELMTKYALDEEILNAARGIDAPDKIVRETWDYTGIFHMCLWEIGSVVALNNDCQVLIRKGGYEFRGGSRTGIAVIGFSKDIERVKLLNSSVQLQAAVALKNYWRTRSRQVEWMTAFDKAKEKRAFLYGFAQGLGVKLRHARGAAVAAAAEEHKMTKESTELVLVTKKRRVADWMDTEYGHTLRNVKNSYSSGGFNARQSGYTAGQAANTSTGAGGIGRGTRGAIGR